MFEALLDADRSLLLAINGAHTPYWDTVMWLYTGIWIWVPVAVTMLYALFRTAGWRETLWTLFVVVLLVLFCDRLPSMYIKPFFARLRPTHDPALAEWVNIVNGYRGGSYSFFSQHASNAAGIVTFTSLLFRNRYYTVTAVVWAAVTCWSRMYLGVHYPGDITVGLMWGTAMAFAAYALYERGRRSLFGASPQPYKGTPLARWVPTVIIVTVAAILIFSPLLKISAMTRFLCV